MKTLVRIAKWFGALAAAAILFLVIVANFGTVESRLECSGEVQWTPGTGPQVIKPATLYAKVEKYRWFILWADHDAMITWDIPAAIVRTGFGYYSQNDFGAPIGDFQGTRHYGSFSPLSKRIHIETASDGQEVFDGICR